MNLNDSEQIRKKLEEEYKENCSKINELNKKIIAISKNDFETKVICTLAFSLIPWVASIFFMPAIIRSGIVPLNMIQPLFVGVPALIGITVEELITRKLKYRERLREFSTSKTEKEKIEESITYEIEREKLKNANKILKKNCDDLSANENLINSLSTSYNITEKDVDERTKEEISDSIENINNVLKKEQQMIDTATTKNVLKEKFWRVRDKFNKVSDVLIYGMMGGVMFMMLYDMPVIYLNQLENIQFQASFFEIFAPLIIGSLACGSYCAKKINDYTSVFKTINNQLGDNAISEFRDYEEDRQIDKNLENIIKDTSAVKLKLESEKQKLDYISEISNELQIHSDDEFVQMGHVESEIPFEDMMSFVEESIFEEQSKEQGPVLKKTLNPNKK